MNEYAVRSSRTRLSRLHEINRQKAWREARRVPADTLAPLIDRYIEWCAFALWARAIVEAQVTIPPPVARAIELRCPGFAPEDGAKTEPEFWLRLWRWIHENDFRLPNEEGWLIAVEYYASLGLRWEQVWLYWEHCDDRWQQTRPDSYPTFEDWRREAQQWRFPPPGRRDMRCDGAHKVAPGQLEKAVSDYVRWEAFAYWVRAVMKGHRGMPPMVDRLLLDRCPGFLEDLMDEGAQLEDSTTVWRRLIAWVDSHVFGSAKAAGWFEAITFFARSSLYSERTVAYWAFCDRKWSRRRPDCCPDFDEWRRQAQTYTEH